MTDTYVVSSTGKYTILKDPEATLDYTFDWTDWLAKSSNDTIATATFTVPTGLVLVSSSVIAAGLKARAFISGGTAGTTYKVTCAITTVLAPNARIEERVIYIKVKQDR